MNRCVFVPTMLLAGGLALVFGAAALAQEAKPAPAPAPPAAPAGSLIDRNHLLGPGDLIEIAVEPTIVPDFSRKVRLFKDGSFDYGKLGTIQAAGLTTKELAEKLTDELKKIFRRPSATVSILEIYVPPPPPKEEKVTPRITVLGAVQKKGVLDLPEPKPLRILIAEIGPTEKADLSRVRVKFQDGTYRNADFATPLLTGDFKDDLVLKGGEEVIVLERPAELSKVLGSVRILGLVLNPNQYELKPGMTLEDLIIAAGKMSLLADPEHVQLRRGGEIRTIDLEAQRRLGLMGQIKLETGDEVFIPGYENTVMLVGVSSPGRRPLKAGQKVREFFYEGGPDVQFALNPKEVNQRAVELHRWEGNSMKVSKIDLPALLRHPEDKRNVELRSGDVLVLQPSKGPARTAMDYIRDLPYVGFLFGLF